MWRATVDKASVTRAALINRKGRGRNFIRMHIRRARFHRPRRRKNPNAANRWLMYLRKLTPAECKWGGSWTGYGRADDGRDFLKRQWLPSPPRCASRSLLRVPRARSGGILLHPKTMKNARSKLHEMLSQRRP